ncbi:mRNA 3'-end-processing protein RNA14 [Leucoagaricus sp. SymC.cos]|nr:mRNA 3'-end-processing protein RNA14 [Leucoagaricus sp. SymC.cos]
MSSEQNTQEEMAVDHDDTTQQSQEPSSPVKPDSPMQVSSTFDSLSGDLKEHSHNPDGWRRLVELAEHSGDSEKIRKTFDALLKQYPNTASAQIAYISFFLNDQSTFSEAEDLFKRFLRLSPSVDLWKFYLTYVRRLNSASGPQTRDIVRKSYEFALNHVGQDKESGEIWSDFIQFLKSADASTTWEEQQKMDVLRKVYHRAVQIPLDNVERLWQELESFETNLNKITAKKFMADLSPAHMQARTVLRQLTNHLSGLFPPSSSPTKMINGRQEIWLPSLPKFDQPERALVGKWKAYLKWEESNPLEIEDKDKATLITRLQGVYRKAVIRMRYYSEIWYMAYIWTSNIGKPDEAIAILKSGIEANPTSYLLNFAYAEALEVRKEFTEVHATYDRFLSALRTELEALEKTIPAAPVTSPNSSQQSQGSSTSQDENPNAKELAERRSEYGLAYVMYMRFGRRAEGVKSSRAIFGKARKDRWTPWEVFEAAALMEYHCSNDRQVASRIFEKGLDTFSGEVDFVLRYLSFLISVNDENNARALFERVIPTFAPDRARQLWERWARYEYQYGDLEAAQKLEKRIAEVYPNDPPIKRFAQRHLYLSIDAIAQRDLGFAIARKESSSSSLTRTETSNSLFSSLHPIISSASKRPSSVDRVRRDESRIISRTRSRSPIRDRERHRDGPRDRDRGWDGPPRKRFSPPPPSGWDREGGGRDRGHRGGGRDDGERTKGVSLPSVLTWFIGELPTPASFDGPVFRTEDLMNVFKNAVIPSSTPRMKSPPPPPRSGGRPPPDYGPYQGPGGGRRARY